MNELNCPHCGETLVESWDLWSYLGEEVECCKRRFEVEYDHTYDPDTGEEYGYWGLVEIK
jgi:hypothetical protein